MMTAEKAGKKGREGKLRQEKVKGTLLGASRAFLPMMGISPTPGATSAAGTQCGHCSTKNKSLEIDIGVQAEDRKSELTSH